MFMCTWVPFPGQNRAENVLGQFDRNDTIDDELTERRPAAFFYCHDDATADLHALNFTDLLNNVETCAVCHSDSDDLSVANIHLVEP